MQNRYGLRWKTEKRNGVLSLMNAKEEWTPSVGGHKWNRAPEFGRRK
jgi:hypothetical protein